MKPKYSYAILLGKILMWVMGLAVIFMLLLRLTNHSPTLDQIIITLLGGILAAIITFGYTIGLHIGEVRRYMRDSDRRFYALARAFERFKHHSH